MTATAPAQPVVLCVGEPLVALTPPVGVALDQADDLLLSVGGAELNVAVTLAGLGVTSRFVGKVGDDPLGQRVIAELDGCGVDSQFVEVDPEAPTALYLKNPGHPHHRVHYYRHGAAGSRLHTVSTSALEGVTHVHLSGITPALSDDCLALTERLLADRTRSVSFDVNYRPALWSTDVAAPILLRLARAAHTIFVGLDEAQTLWGCATALDVRALVTDAAEVVVKDEDRPATAFTGPDRTVEPAGVVAVVEPIGAGDAFAAGYLKARLAADSPAAALRSGHRLAAAALSVRGDHSPPKANNDKQAVPTNDRRSSALR